MSIDTDTAQLRLNDAELETVCQLALDEAKKLGATQADVGVSCGSGLSVSVRLGEVETIEHNQDKGLGVTVYFDQRKGSSNTSDFSEAAVRQSVQAACSIAKYTAEDECAGLAEAGLMATKIPDLDLLHPWDISAEQMVDMAARCEQAARDYDVKISNSEGATIARHSGVSIYANTHGFFGRVDSSHHSSSCSVIGGQGDAMQRDYWYSSARNPKNLENVESVGQQAAQRTLRRLGAKSIATGVYPVLYSPEMARSLLGTFTSAISGGSLYRKTTFLLDKLGEPVFSPLITINEQPLLMGELGSSPFDNEGVARHNRCIVEGGVLQGHFLSSYSARKLGVKTTGNAGGARNLVLQAGSYTPKQLFEKMGGGFYVTEMMGSGVNLSTGDYSRGAAGFWVENGEIAYPVEEVTVAGNLADMFLNIRAVCNDMDKRGNIHTGSILIGQMTVAGT